MLRPRYWQGVHRRGDPADVSAGSDALLLHVDLLDNGFLTILDHAHEHRRLDLMIVAVQLLAAPGQGTLHALERCDGHQGFTYLVRVRDGAGFLDRLEQHAGAIVEEHVEGVHGSRVEVCVLLFQPLVLLVRGVGRDIGDGAFREFLTSCADDFGHARAADLGEQALVAQFARLTDDQACRAGRRGVELDDVGLLDKDAREERLEVPGGALEQLGTNDLVLELLVRGELHLLAVPADLVVGRNDRNGLEVRVILLEPADHGLDDFGRRRQNAENIVHVLEHLGGVGIHQTHDLVLFIHGLYRQARCGTQGAKDELHTILLDQASGGRHTLSSLVGVIVGNHLQLVGLVSDLQATRVVDFFGGDLGTAVNTAAPLGTRAVQCADHTDLQDFFGGSASGQGEPEYHGCRVL